MSDSPVKLHIWSRDKKEKKATVTHSAGEPDNADQTMLVTKTWDGGAGSVEEPSTINGHPYDIVSGKATHDVVFTLAPVDPAHLSGGKALLRLYSDTRHRGIEMLLPGPCLIARQKPRADVADTPAPAEYARPGIGRGTHRRRQTPQNRRPAPQNMCHCRPRQC
ncbi:MAG: hypothetical protein GF331_04840 [Chitinivibrionales bacterium]|nr:hypothetical protein [Chitinivibrionales bacterium]